MPLVDVQHFVKNVCRKRSYAPTLALTRVKWGQEVSLGAQPTVFWINLRIIWTEFKIDRSFSTKCLLRTCSSFFGNLKTVQLSDISLTSKPCLEARSLVHEGLYNCQTLPWHQNSGWKPGLWCLEVGTTVWQYLDIKSLLSNRSLVHWRLNIHLRLHNCLQGRNCLYANTQVRNEIVSN